jgi:general secretion pathway protein I
VPSSSAKPDRTAGFSLIEALVALVIAGLALTAIAGVFGTGLIGHQASDEAATALTLAEGKLAAAGASEALRPGRSAGVFAGRYSWALTIAAYNDRQDADRQTKAGAPDAALPLSALRVYRIETIVAWREGAGQRRLALSTLRLGPAPP